MHRPWCSTSCSLCCCQLRRPWLVRRQRWVWSRWRSCTLNHDLWPVAKTLGKPAVENDFGVVKRGNIDSQDELCQSVKVRIWKVYFAHSHQALCPSHGWVTTKVTLCSSPRHTLITHLMREGDTTAEEHAGSSSRKGQWTHPWLSDRQEWCDQHHSNNPISVTLMTCDFCHVSVWIYDLHIHSPHTQVILLPTLAAYCFLFEDQWAVS